MQAENSTKRLQLFVGLAVAWPSITGLVVLELWPDLRKTALGWFLLVVVGPPVCLRVIFLPCSSSLREPQETLS